MTPHTDLGYFGPDSITWRIHGEPVAMVGGLRALLLQALHPEAMAALYAASSFRDNPWPRLQHTIRYVATVSFAPRADVDRAAAHVRGVHRRLGIEDVDQLAWVHACLLDSFLAAARSAGVPLNRGDADRYIAEQVVAGELAGVPDGRIVRTQRDLDEYFAAMRPHLGATDEAREAARYLIAPPIPVPRRFVVPARMGWTALAALAVGSLPGWARRMYRLPPVPGIGLATATSLRTLRMCARLAPARYVQGPMYLEAKRRAAASGSLDAG